LLKFLKPGNKDIWAVFIKKSLLCSSFSGKTPQNFKKTKIHLMDFKQIQELIKIINKSNIGELSIEDENFKITIKQKEEKVQTVVATPPAAPVFVSTPSVAATPQATSTPPSATTPQPTPKAENLITIKSPMIGTFYRRSSPDKPAFVEAGDEITPGKVVCIIEAMKLFNEIESEVSGTIVKVLVDDASPVEYDQPLFLVEPA
jgi:acetyl-CoA carboxylase biotin carboxyl carrier protein